MDYYERCRLAGRCCDLCHFRSLRGETSSRWPAVLVSKPPRLNGPQGSRFAIMSTDQLCPIPLDATWIPRALLLSEEAGWNQNAADWKVFLTHGTVLGFSIRDRLVATAAALPYGDGFGWISMVLVAAEWRRRGLATRLVAACTALLRDAGRAALLDAAPAATAIYGALGFIPVGTLERWEGDGGGSAAAT